MRYFSWLFLVLMSCNISEKVEVKPVNISQVVAHTSESGSVKSFANPTIIYGSDFISFLAQLKMSNPGRREVLLDFTSAKTKAEYSPQRILSWYEKTNLNFHKKLKAIRKVNDTLYILNYESNIYATKSIRTFTISVEQDTCRLVIDLKTH